jgi:hypothetical protein
VFHVELRQFPHVARAFNLERNQLEKQILGPWVRRGAATLDDRRFTRDRGKIKIYQAPELGGEELGLGRGWSNVARTGEDVTAALLEAAQREATRDPAVEQLKGELLPRLEQTLPLPLPDAVRVAAALQPAVSSSTALARAEQAVWELLHENAIELLAEHQPVERQRWQSLLLDWETWAGAHATTFAIRRARSSPEANR